MGFLANKCSIASRIDCFTEAPTNLFGKALHNQVEDRLKFYETGEAPMKNEEAMHAVIEELKQFEDVPEKKKKKTKSGEEEAPEAEAAASEEAEMVVEEPVEQK